MRLIDADALWLTTEFIDGEKHEYYEKFEVRDAPTIEVEPIRHGHWNVIDQAEPRRYGCSRCKRMRWTTENYCPYCGAKMDEGEV